PDMASPLLRHPKIVATPHLGASTEEAQVGVALDVAEQVMEILDGKPARSAVNLPGVTAEVMAKLGPFLTLAEKMGRLAGALNQGLVRSARVTFSGDVAKQQTAPLTRSFLMGLLQPVLEERVNLVNAALIADQRVLNVTEATETSCTESEITYPSLISVEVLGDSGTNTVSGTVIGRSEIRIVSINGYRVDLVPEGAMLITMHTDKPGMIGKVGSLLGEKGINIAGMHLGRANPR